MDASVKQSVQTFSRFGKTSENTSKKVFYEYFCEVLCVSVWISVNASVEFYVKRFPCQALW